MVGLIRTVLLFCVCVISSVHANPLQRIEVAEDTFALIGPMEQRSETNLANNANFGFIVGERGVVLIDSGGTLKGAQAIEAQIRAVTDKPIVLVINTGGQDHRWFGNRYFADQGVRTLTSAQTLADQDARGDAQITSTSRYTQNSWQGTEPMPAQEAISTLTDMTVEGIQLQLIPVGPAHTGGEMLVWLPDSRVLFSGDVVYMDRMLGIGAQSQHLAWIGAFKKIKALNPGTIVPGHGQPTNMAGAERDTYRYLVFLRDAVGKLLEEGEDMSVASRIDQSAFSYLKVYEQIHGRNALRVFEEMEWE